MQHLLQFWSMNTNFLNTFSYIDVNMGLSLKCFLFAVNSGVIMEIMCELAKFLFITFEQMLIEK